MDVIVHIGVDVGQRVDPTGICVAELERRGRETHYLIRHLERLTLNTSYPAVVARLAAIQHSLQARATMVAKLGQKASPIKVSWWVDATGVGQPVVDLLRGAGLPVTPVFFTASDKATTEGGELRLGKALLVSRLQVLLQCGRIHLPRMAEASALVDELLNYEIRVSDSANAQFGAFKTGQHDDLATALGLACWAEPPGSLPTQQPTAPSRWTIIRDRTAWSGGRRWNRRI